MNEVEFLVDWMIRFFENRDTIKNNIIKIKKNEKGSDFVVYYKDRTKYFIVKTMMETSVFNKMENNENFGIVTLNNKENIRFVFNNWKKLIDFKFLSFYFVNPFSNSDKMWVLTPNIHDKICDKDSLKLGLKSMSEMVEPIDYINFKRMIKLSTEESGL